MSTLAGALVAGCSDQTSPAPVASSEPAPESREDAIAEAPQDAGRVPLAADDTPKSSTTFCAADEPKIFSCTLRGGKIVSVCLASGAQGEFAQYRFGKPDSTPELAWPTNANEQMEWASVPYSGGGEAQLSFVSGDVRYVVYSKVVRTNFTAGEPNDSAITDGVAVLQSGKVTANFVCDGVALQPVDVTAAEAHLKKADDLFTYDIE